MIYEVLLHGKENAITGKALCNMLNMNHRELTLNIEAERRAGLPICASCGSPKGYYIATNQEELKDFCHKLWKRAGEIHKTRKACMEIMPSLPPLPSE